MSFTDQKRWEATEHDIETRWGSSKGLWCYLCSHKFDVGEGIRWIYMNSESPSYGNFMVCDECDTEDVKEIWREANKLLVDSARGRKEHWPVDVVVKLLREVNAYRKYIEGLAYDPTLPYYVTEAILEKLSDLK